MKRCLVTGGAGFIGANLVRKLLEQKHVVHILIEKNTDLWRLHDVENNITIHKIDLREHDKINQLINTVKPESIFHLASYGGMPNQNDQKLIFDVNFHGTVNLVNACKKAGFDCFINTGSSSEYGIKNSPMSEENVLEPITDYAVAKAAASQFCFKEAAFNKLPIYTVRPFAVYGDYEAPTRLLPTVIIHSLIGLPIELSRPNYVRDFIHISDMVDILLRISLQKPEGFYIFNAGTGTQSTIKDVVDTTQKLINQPILANWGIKESRPWEPANWLANTDLAQLAMAWKANYTLEQGLKKTIDWFSKNLDLYVSKDHHAKPTIKTTITSATH